MVSGSRELTPNSRLFRTRPSANAATTPSNKPANTGRSASPITIWQTSPGRAPRAIRMPISFLRRETDHDTMP